MTRTRIDNARVIRSPRGPELSAKSWLTEAPLRMLMNNLDPEVAEKPHELVVYGGIGRAARDWESFDRIVAALRALDDDETLLVQSGKPVGGLRAPRGAGAGGDGRGPARHARRRVPPPRRRAPRAHRQLEPRPRLRHLGPF